MPPRGDPEGDPEQLLMSSVEPFQTLQVRDVCDNVAPPGWCQRTLSQVGTIDSHGRGKLPVETLSSCTC